ncbi:MAG TPA: cation-transporting P-type ATPase, partial [Parafilimonas sp.]|nr:cation-transporting P-type ATPase [Parafilimonas sp.]
MIPAGKQKLKTQNGSNVFFNERKLFADKLSCEAYLLHISEVASLLQTSLENGLTQKQINERLAAFGYNRLTAQKEKTPLQILLQQFTGVAVYLLLAAAFI